MTEATRADLTIDDRAAAAVVAAQSVQTEGWYRPTHASWVVLFTLADGALAVSSTTAPGAHVARFSVNKLAEKGLVQLTDVNGVATASLTVAGARRVALGR